MKDCYIMDMNELAIEHIEHQRRYRRALLQWFERNHNHEQAAYTEVIIAILDEVDTTSVESIRHDLRMAADLIRNVASCSHSDVSIRLPLRAIQTEVDTYYDLH